MQFLKNYFLVLLVSAIALSVPLWELHDNYNEQEQFIDKEIEGARLLDALVIKFICSLLRTAQ